MPDKPDNTTPRISLAHIVDEVEAALAALNADDYRLVLIRLDMIRESLSAVEKMIWRRINRNIDAEVQESGEVKLSQLQNILAFHERDVLRRENTDPVVYLVDQWGARQPLTSSRVDWVPQTQEEAETDIRHPVVELFAEQEGTV